MCRGPRPLHNFSASSFFKEVRTSLKVSPTFRASKSSPGFDLFTLVTNSSNILVRRRIVIMIGILFRGWLKIACAKRTMGILTLGAFDMEVVTSHYLEHCEHVRSSATGARSHIGRYFRPSIFCYLLEWKVQPHEDPFSGFLMPSLSALYCLTLSEILLALDRTLSGYVEVFFLMAGYPPP